MPPARVILSIIGIVVVLFAAYFVTYYVGMKASGQTRAGVRNRNIAVLDRFAFSRDKFFCVVEIAGKVYIVGVTNNAMTVLDTYDADEYAELIALDGDDTVVPWANTPVGQYGNKLTKKVVAFVASKMGSSKKKESFAESMRKASEENQTSGDTQAPSDGDSTGAEGD